MRIHVRLFAMLRERAGAGVLELDVPDDARVGDALEAVDYLVAGIPVVMAVNRRYADPDSPLAPGDELALIPPVSGGGPGTPDGQPEVQAQVSEEPLSCEQLQQAVRDPRAGAVVSFQGVTREVDHLQYEAYREMALDQLTQIARDALERNGLCRVAVAHRVGRVPLSEPSVVVAVSAPHREQAFAAAREIIDQIKERAPIWKQEVEGEVAEWVPGRTPMT